MLTMTAVCGATVVLPASAASAATTCVLDVIRNPYNPTLYTVRVDCDLSDPNATYDSFTVYGSDSWFDDTVLIVGRWETPGLPRWRVERRNVNGFTLDEDWGEDELYAKARITRATGTSFLVTTNEVSGEYAY
jgi:hypothetical protein